MSRFLLTNALLFDGLSPHLREVHVLVDGGRIAEIGDGPLRSPSAQVIDLRGRTLMPGLIDAHLHVYYARVNPLQGDRLPMTYVAHRAARMLEDSLRRGFTTVRDAGGADYGLAMAVEAGLIAGPRLLYAGRSLSQTGGHGDRRDHHEEDLCGCAASYAGHLSEVVDGPDAMRRAVRERLWRGAHYIKLMGSGGVSSTGDPLHAPQLSDEEILAAQDEVKRHGTYLTMHIHPDGAMRRAIELGVRHIEHGTLASEETARLAARTGTGVVPTVATIRLLARHGPELGFSPASMAKLRDIEPDALAGLERLHRAGVALGWGTDLIGPLERFQTEEFAVRREVLPALDILRSATSVNAEIIGRPDLGRVVPGAPADLIAVDGNPLEDITLFDQHGTHVSVVMKAGMIYRNMLDRR